MTRRECQCAIETESGLEGQSTARVVTGTNPRLLRLARTAERGGSTRFAQGFLDDQDRGQVIRRQSC